MPEILLGPSGAFIPDALDVAISLEDVTEDVAWMSLVRRGLIDNRTMDAERYYHACDWCGDFDCYRDCD